MRAFVLFLIILFAATQNIYAIDCKYAVDGYFDVSPSTVHLYAIYPDLDTVSYTIRVAGFVYEESDNASSNSSSSSSNDYCWFVTTDSNWITFSGNQVPSYIHGDGSFTFTIDKAYITNSFDEHLDSMEFTGNLIVESNFSSSNTKQVAVTLTVLNGQRLERQCRDVTNTRIFASPTTVEATEGDDDIVVTFHWDETDDSVSDLPYCYLITTSDSSILVDGQSSLRGTTYADNITVELSAVVPADGSVTLYLLGTANAPSITVPFKLLQKEEEENDDNGTLPTAIKNEYQYTTEDVIDLTIRLPSGNLSYYLFLLHNDLLPGQVFYYDAEGHVVPWSEGLPATGTLKPYDDTVTLFYNLPLWGLAGKLRVIAAVPEGQYWQILSDTIYTITSRFNGVWNVIEYYNGERYSYIDQEKGIYAPLILHETFDGNLEASWLRPNGTTLNTVMAVQNGTMSMNFEENGYVYQYTFFPSSGSIMNGYWCVNEICGQVILEKNF